MSQMRRGTYAVWTVAGLNQDHSFPSSFPNHVCWVGSAEALSLCEAEASEALTFTSTSAALEAVTLTATSEALEALTLAATSEALEAVTKEAVTWGEIEALEAKAVSLEALTFSVCAVRKTVLPDLMAPPCLVSIFSFCQPP